MEMFNSQIQRIRSMARSMSYFRYNFLLYDLQDGHNEWNQFKLERAGYKYYNLSNFAEIRHKNKTYNDLFQ